MAQDMDNDLQTMEETLRESIRYTRQTRKITTIGSIVIVGIFLIFGVFIYNEVTDFDTAALQQTITSNAPAVLNPEIEKFKNDIVQSLFPKILETGGERIQKEMPKLHTEIEKQMVILIGEIEESINNQLTSDSSKVVRQAIYSGVEQVNLDEKQKKAIEQFADESIEYILVDMEPFFKEQTKKISKMLTNLYDTVHELENTSFAAGIQPSDIEDASTKLLKSMLELAAIKLEQEEVKEMLRADLLTNITLPKSLTN